LYYVLPVPVAWALGFVVRTLLAGLFTAMLVRSLGGTTTGAFVAAVLFAFCGFLTAWNGTAMADTAIWLPLICYSVVRLHLLPSAKNSAIAGFAFAMPVLAGHPETATHLILLGTLLAIYL